MLKSVVSMLKLIFQTINPLKVQRLFPERYSDQCAVPNSTINPFVKRFQNDTSLREKNRPTVGDVLLHQWRVKKLDNSGTKTSGVRKCPASYFSFSCYYTSFVSWIEVRTIQIDFAGEFFELLSQIIATSWNKDAITVVRVTPLSVWEYSAILTVLFSFSLNICCIQFLGWRNFLFKWSCQSGNSSLSSLWTKLVSFFTAYYYRIISHSDYLNCVK